MAELFTQLIIPQLTLSEILTPQQVGTLGLPAAQNYLTIGSTIQGSAYKTGDIGARLEIFPEWDPTIAQVVFNATGTEVFKIEIDGANTGDITLGSLTGDYLLWDGANIQINTEGLVNVLSGGDIRLNNTASDTGELQFYDNVADRVLYKIYGEANGGDLTGFTQNSDGTFTPTSTEAAEGMGITGLPDEEDEGDELQEDVAAIDDQIEESISQFE